MQPYRFTSSLIISSCLLHVFCCGLPLLLSLGSFAGLVSISGGALLDHSVLERYEIPVLVFSGAVLACSIMVYVISRLLDCRKQGSCHHEPCAPKKTMTKQILCISCLVYTLNIGLFLLH